LAIPAAYLLARRFLGRGPALLATAWVAVSLLSVWFSQQSRPHGPAAALALVAVLAAMRLQRCGTLGAYLTAGVASGLAIGALQSGVAVVIPFAVAQALRPW